MRSGTAAAPLVATASTRRRTEPPVRRRARVSPTYRPHIASHRAGHHFRTVWGSIFKKARHGVAPGGRPAATAGGFAPARRPCRARPTRPAGPACGCGGAEAARGRTDRVDGPRTGRDMRRPSICRRNAIIWD
ncbi:hypothetical protein A33K_18535 [Burkholderia humptydooensis MSMB43]|uniref:Uncharacterized protein n=1 Tax=Burkholderia humptydooensis MSMB43 TaxID=441157 RepID=A0ABN0FY80_9BURK|nr:hypothetical protein A33K_18535 [Burkholderia humptydooensis MSMB43]